MAAPVREGEILAGKYRVDRVLGEGGMGVVVAATHMQLDQKVALKFMLPQAFANPEALARFQREARAAVRLKSEHVARVSDTGTFENGSPYIVMEFLEGVDLAGEIEQKGQLPVPMVAEYIVQACDALAEAHALGIVHRDLKPANLFITRRADGSPLVKVLDFGISKANSLTEGGLGMTKTASMMGSPLYMSPEQMRSAKDVDARTDVWSMGIVMYEMLTGRVPFMSETLGDLLAKVMTESHPPLEQVRPDLPPQILALVNRCLEKDVNRRCSSVAEIAQGLAPFCPPRSLPIVERISGVLGVRPAPAAAAPLRQTGPLASSVNAVVTSAQTANGYAPPGSSNGVKIVAIIGGAVVALGAAAAIVAFALHVRGGASATTDTHAQATSTAPVTVSAAATALPAPPPPTETAPTPTPNPIASASAQVATSTTSKPSTATAGNAHATAHPTASAAKSAAPAQTTAPTTKKPGLLDDSN